MSTDRARVPAAAAPDTASGRAERDMSQAWRTLSVVGLASVVTGFAMTSLNIALPAMSADLGASAGQASAVLVGFQFTMTALMLLFGRLADISGRRRMYLAGIVLFGLASLVIAVMPGIEFVLALRVLQAVGAAMLLTNSAALVSDAFPPDRLGQGMGFYIASFSVAQLLGPVGGGALIGVWGWRSLFWINVPLCALCLIWALLALPADPGRGRRRVRLDVPGNLIALLALGSLLIGLTQAAGAGWTSPPVLGGLAGFAVLVAVLLGWERRYPEPLLELSLLADRGFAFGLSGTFFNAVGRFPPALLLPIQLQAIGGLTAAAAGLWVLPFVIASLIGSIGYGVFAPRVSPRAASVSASLAATVGLGALVATVSEPEPGAWFVLGQVLTGLGAGAYLPATTTTMLQGLPSARLGVANGLRLVVLNTGATLGIALTTTLLASRSSAEVAARLMAGEVSDLPAAEFGAVVDGFALAYGACFAVSAAGTALNLWECRPPGGVLSARRGRVSPRS